MSGSFGSKGKRASRAQAVLGKLQHWRMLQKMHYKITNCWRSVEDCVQFARFMSLTLVLSALTGTCLHDIPGRNFKKCVALNELKLNGNNRLKMPQQISRNKSANRDPCACLQGFVQLTAFSPHELHGQSTSILLHWKSSSANDQLCQVVPNLHNTNETFSTFMLFLLFS